jgi:hypothetical protein
MALSQEQLQGFLDALEESIYSGVTSVSYEGKTASYRDFDAMMRARALLRQKLGLSNPPATVLAEHSRGFRDDNGDV